MAKNPQSGSTASSSGSSEEKKSSHSAGSAKRNKALPPLFFYMEMGDWQKATERAKKHPREAKTWATLRTKSQSNEAVSSTQRLALHHACSRLRTVPTSSRSTGTNSGDDQFLEVCKFLLLLIQLYPEAAGMRESRHGCLPLHLAAFASCAPRARDDPLEAATVETGVLSTHRLSAHRENPTLDRPGMIHARSISDSTANTSHTHLSATMAEESFTGAQTVMHKRQVAPDLSPQKRSHVSNYQTTTQMFPATSPTSSATKSANMKISAKREEMAVKVINALLDAYPKAIKVDSEGGRLPLHTACAGRATPLVISTLVSAYPAAARHRNKDGFLPIHLAAHWGVSHPNVAITLLKAYPDSTLGRNRWERTPLEEALCMAGENGRDHQAALVRCLRKHPTYWQKPAEELFRPGGRVGSATLVDMDDTIADDDTSTTDNDTTGVDTSQQNIASMDLGTLIKNQNWSAVVERLDTNPHAAGENLNAIMKGGFVATKGCTPLHFACERRPPVEVVSSLIEAWPEAVTTRLHPGGFLPLHLACIWYAPADAITVLIQADTATCRVTDELGNLPLHHAAFSGAAAPVTDCLLRTYPKAILARNHQGSLAYDIVKRLRHDNRKTILNLLSIRKDELLSAQHRRTRSAGSVSSVAQRAMAMNLQSVPRAASPQKSKDVGIEVTYDESVGDMMWI